MKIIAMATFHEQPPFDTPAKIVIKAKQFHPQEKILVIQEWVEEQLKTLRIGCLTKLELDIEQ